MRIHFWGVRGSLPATLSGAQVQAKIASVLRLATADDIISVAARKRFLSSLPYWLYGTAGSDTPCVQLVTEKSTNIILDAGSGIRQLGKAFVPSNDNHYNIFLSHLHWDHIQGIPFFDAIYNPHVTIDFYSAHLEAENVLAEQMDGIRFPVSWKTVADRMRFHNIAAGKPFAIGKTTVNCCKMSHPGDSYAYSFEYGGKKFVYATDVELAQDDLKHKNKDYNAVFGEADVVVLDSQYTQEEASKKTDWGHSTFHSAVDFAAGYGAGNLYLFHHDPCYDDEKIAGILAAAQKYSDGRINVHLAIEGEEIDI